MTTKGGSHEPERPSALPAKAATADLGTLVDQLVKLGLDFAAEALPAILTRAVKEDMGSPALLEQLLRGELERREERRVRTSLRLSGLPTGQTLANFDFAFQPAVQRSKLEALATCAWLREKQGLLILGPPGVGKTHLAISLGVKAVECGFSVAFFRLEELLHAMRKDADVPPTRLKGKKYMKAGLVIIDEVGFETFTREEANLFFRLVSYRYQRGLAVHHVEQGDQGLAGDAGRRRGDHDGDPGPSAALVPRAEHPGSELSAAGPGRRPERAVVSGVEVGYVPGLRSLLSEQSLAVLEEPSTAAEEESSRGLIGAGRGHRQNEGTRGHVH